MSPMIFKHKSESMFNFARSQDPNKSNAADMDEIHVPESIQDLIERNIRSLSNGISHNSELQKVAFESLNTIDFREMWFTKKELLQKDKNANPLIAFKQKQKEESHEGTKNGYNLTEHSANIRVKFNKEEAEKPKNSESK